MHYKTNGKQFTIVSLAPQKSNQLQANKLLTKVKVLQRGWTVSFAVKPTGVVTGLANIIHATLGENDRKYGDRTPGVWFKSKTTELYICSAISGNKDKCFISQPLPKNKFTTIIIRQFQKKDFKYYFQIFINGKKEFEIINSEPRIFKNVKYYGSDPWHKAAKCILKDFDLKMFSHKGENLVK